MYKERTVPVGIVAIAIVAIIGAIGFIATLGWVRISGSEVGVRETLSGLDPNPLPPGSYFPVRWTTKIYTYDLTTQVFVMNDDPPKEKQTKGRDYDPYLVQSSDQQDMHINFSVRWRYDPSKIIDIHKNYHSHVDADPDIIEERLIRNAAQLVVKNHATKMKAAEAYAGEGLVRLQQEIEKDLADPSYDLRSQGIIVENFVIEKIGLDPKYVEEIKARQIATQKVFRATEETKAATAEALKIEAEASAEAKKRVVVANADKEVFLLKASQESEAKTIAIKAEAQQIQIRAEADKMAAEARAAAVVAEGRAKAESQELMFKAYSTPGAQVFASIEFSRNLATAYSGVKGWIPQGMSINTFTTDFMSGIKSVVSPTEK